MLIKQNRYMDTLQTTNQQEVHNVMQVMNNMKMGNSLNVLEKW